MGGRSQVSQLIPAVIVDRAGKTHRVEALACNGNTYFVFIDGNATLEVPFLKIKTLSVLGKKGDKLEVEIKTVDGKSYKFETYSDVDCTGYTPLGKLEISLQAVKEIEFKGVPKG